MLEREQDFYRKWLGISQLCRLRPLVMVVKGDEVLVSHHGKQLITYTSDGYQRFTANEISKQLEELGAKQ